MKALLFGMLLILFSCQEDTATKVAPSTDSVKTESSAIADITEDEEDCDDKFKKAQEQPKKIDENNLFGKNEADEGCTLE